MLIRALRDTRNVDIRNRDTDVRPLLALCMVLAFMTVSALFEPDFGSWVRHESAAFPLLWMAFRSSANGGSVIHSS